MDIHAYDLQELLRLLASLLGQIATTNDSLHGRDFNPAYHMHALSSPSSPTSDAHLPPIWRTLTTASRTALSGNMSLTFHARNIPTITLEAYLLRIMKYCPASNEVFLSLLVYFDRMSKLSKEACGKPFVIDSYNIHRLVIAGVTVASKFFSDVFYTNSRYAKVRTHPSWNLACGASRLTHPHTGWRSSPGRAQPARAAVPAAERLPAHDSDSRDATLRRAINPVLTVRPQLRLSLGRALSCADVLPVARRSCKVHERRYRQP